MIRTGQYIQQKQTQQQKLSPQQLQYVQLLQLPGLALEQRIKEEIELNPVLEEFNLDADGFGSESGDSSFLDTDRDTDRDGIDEQDLDWDRYYRNIESDGDSIQRSFDRQGDISELPNPYHESILEKLEQQVNLLDLTEEENLIAEQILGSIDEDGYFRRDPEAVADNIAFNHGLMVTTEQVEQIRKKIQRLDPIGVASSDLRECLLVQLDILRTHHELAAKTYHMIDQEWSAFEKKQFPRLLQRLSVSESELKEMVELVRSLNPKPGGGESDLEVIEYVDADFEVHFIPEQDKNEESSEVWRRTAQGDTIAARVPADNGEFVIKLNQRHVPLLRISPRYRQMWESMKGSTKSSENLIQKKETQSFIREKLESAQWFLDSIRQRQQTLLNTMKTIVELQPDFFRSGHGLRPMILKDIASIIKMDISTVSRVVNGKFVQTPFGVFELKYFFSEGVETESGEEVSNREIKLALSKIIDKEDKRAPLSDSALQQELAGVGYKVARRTVSKYREMLHIPVARLRRGI